MPFEGEGRCPQASRWLAAEAAWATQAVLLQAEGLDVISTGGQLGCSFSAPQCPGLGPDHRGPDAAQGRTGSLRALKGTRSKEVRGAFTSSYSCPPGRSQRPLGLLLGTERNAVKEMRRKGRHEPFPLHSGQTLCLWAIRFFSR